MVGKIRRIRDEFAHDKPVTYVNLLPSKNKEKVKRPK